VCSLSLSLVCLDELVDHQLRLRLELGVQETHKEREGERERFF